MDTVVDMEIDVVVSSLFPFLNEPSGFTPCDLSTDLF